MKVEYSRLFFLLVCCLVVLPFFLLAGYNHPSSDDYLNQVTVNQRGFYSMLISYLESWGGRYVSGLLVFFLNPLQFANHSWIAVFTCIQLCFYILFWYLITLLIEQQFQLKQGKLPVFSVLLVYGFCYLHSPVELLYWFSGSWTYLPGLVMLAAWTWIRFSTSKDHHLIQKWGYVGLPFLIAGTNELNVLFMAILFVLPGKISPQLSKLRIVSIALFSIGVGFALFSPGNQIRAEVCKKGGNPVYDYTFSIQNSLRISWFYFRDWTRSGPLLILPLILVFLLGKKTGMPSSKKIMGITFLGIVFYLFLTVPFFWATGLKVPPGRVLDLLFLTLVMIVVFSGTSLLLLNAKNLNVSPIIPKLLLASLFWIATYNSKYHLAILDLKEIDHYEEEFTNRIQRVEKAAHTNPTDTLIVPKLTKRPFTIFYTELNTNSKHWFNRGFARYYGVAGIKAIDSPSKN